MSIAQFVWYDVMTTDCRAAEQFYRDVIGWNTVDSGVPDRTYILLSAGSTMVGGLMPIPEEAAAAGAKPAWMGYIGVSDVDAYAKKSRGSRWHIASPARKHSRRWPLCGRG